MEGTFATLFSCHRPVEQYRQRLAAASDLVTSPGVALLAIDSFLMRQVVSYYPVAPVIVDFAADATRGESTVLWLSTPEKDRLISPLSDSGGGQWRGAFAATLESLGLDDTATYPPPGEGEWQEMCRRVGARAPLIYSVAQREEEAGRLAEKLSELIRARPGAVIMLFPVGPVGASQIIEEALRFCARATGYRVRLLRELGPSFSMSQTALIFPTADHDVPAVLERLRLLLDGNFDPLTLARDLTDALIREKQGSINETEVARLQRELARAWTWREGMKRLLSRALPARLMKAMKSARDAARS